MEKIVIITDIKLLKYLEIAIKALHRIMEQAGPAPINKVQAAAYNYILVQEDVILQEASSLPEPLKPFGGICRFLYTLMPSVHPLIMPLEQL